MESVHTSWISAEQYLAREQQAETKNEYYDGSIYAMSGAMPVHNLLVANVIGELRNGLRGGDCRVYASDLKVTTPNGKRYFYPDATIICGEPVLWDEHKDVVTNPKVIIEVLSASTAAYDRGQNQLKSIGVELKLQEIYLDT